ncbi:hypothetical protein BCR32DRAFT_298227 [Anaeromyces robustus]|uniref:Peptidase S59 domain-containing protein n=1 Tax=Anaeromyces robustus TaxID=1754192 RepID=A0A1Y1VTK4_9FUNG|nr:hypothetical protein BCR32DRAFT_298227 [Anaeromyces robustus]|eukprot:ORX64064.1 hypothetical protein BCR32DRAFT_298227 [Anaeromyces robustus]
MFGSSGFGNQNTSGFGTSNNGFGTSSFGNTGFGNNQQNNSIGGFGQSTFGNTQTSAFGSNNSFGNKPFGQSSLFGNNNQSSFGFNNNNNNTFGSNNAFGTKTSFLNNNNTSSAFGGNTGGFGQQNNSGFGAFNSNMGMQNNQGTGNPPFSVHSEKEPNLPSPSNFHSITAMPQYRNFSFEELRLKDYQMNKKFPSSGFNSSTNFGSGGFMNSNNSGFGQKPFGSTTNTFGNNQMNSFGTNNAFGSNNTFGSNNNTGTGLFGNNQNNSGFGMNNNNNGFGSSIKPANNGFGFGNSSGFGSNNNNNNNSAFGNNNNTSSFVFGNNQNNNTSAFGSNTNAFGIKSNSTGTTGFGTQNNNGLSMNKPSNTTGLFNSSFSTFGSNNNNTSNSLFGGNNNNNNTGGLFGNNNNTTSGGLFGNKTTLGTGLFGSNNNKPATSTLNTANKPLFSFNSTGTTNTTLGNQQNSLFQNKPATTGFSSFSTVKPATGGLFGSTTTTLGGMNTGLNQPPLQASIDQTPYGINPLFETANTSNISGSSIAEVSESSKTKKSVSSSHYRTTPKATTRIKLQGFSAPSPGLKPELSKKALFDSKNIDDPILGNKLVTRKSIKKLIITKEDDKSETIKPISSSLFIQKGNKKINFNENLEISTPSSKQKLSVTPFTVNKNSGSVSKSSIFLTPSKVTNETVTNETKIETKIETNVERHEAKSSYINDYIVSPSLSEMNRMSNEELKHVKNLIVTYPGIGSVHFLEPVDLISASPTHDRNGIVKIFGNVIIIEPKVCTVYPGEENKPPVGQGLNVPAHIELLKCWTMDKTTQKPIVDVEHPRFKRHMKKLKTMPDTEFISFDIETGCWSFNVEHFSRYGLFNDDDDEDDDIETERHIVKYCKIRQNSQDKSRCGVYEVVSVDLSSDESDEELKIEKKEKVDEHEKKDLLKKIVSGELELLAEEVYHSSTESIEGSSSSSEDGSSDEKKLKNKDSFSKNERKLKGKNAADTLKRNHSKGKKEMILSKRKHNVKNEDLEKYSEDQPLKKLKSKNIELKDNLSITQKDEGSNINNIIEHAESISYNHEKNYKNIGLALSRSFRAGWGPGGVLITKLPDIIKNTSDGNIVAMEKIVIHKLNLFDNDEMKVKEQHRITLQNQLNHTKIINEKDQIENEDKNTLLQNQDKQNIVEIVPKAELLPKISFECFTDIFNEKTNDIFTQNEIMIWKLGEALFDPILINTSENDEIVEKALDENKNQYFSKMFKKERINQWLEEFIQDEVEQNIIDLRKKIRSTKDKTQLRELHNEIIFNLLSGRKLNKACKEVVKQGDYRLATVLAQCGSCFENTEIISYGKGVPGSGVMDNYTQNLINQQIALWENETKDSTFKSNYINLWKLIGGQVDEVCYGLNSWKRTFALFVWFANGGMDEFKESLAKYDQILESQRNQEIVRKEDLISEPLPSYFENQLYKNEEDNNNNLNLISSNNSEEEEEEEGRSDRIFESFDMKKKPKHFDIIYHLFKYYVDRSYPKSKIFSPQNISSDMLDYRIPWLINSLLTKTQSHNENDKKIQDKLSISLAFQLENLGMWDWACYVCLFISDKDCREKAIKNLLYRYYPIDDHSGSVYQELCSVDNNKDRKLIVKKNDDSDNDKEKELENLRDHDYEHDDNDYKKETNVITSKDDDENQTVQYKNSDLWNFLVNELKIPKMWIHEARIMKAHYLNDAVLEAIYLIDAQCWNEVHSLVINKIIPEAIISNNTTFASNILKKINKEKVQDWKNDGELFLTYLNTLENANTKMLDTSSTKELLEKLNTILKSIQNQLNKMEKNSSEYSALLKRKICLNYMCKELVNCLVDHETNKENNNDLILSFSIPENQRLYNIKKVSNEWFDNTITV